MNDAIPTPKGYPGAMLVALGVIIDTLQKDVEANPEVKGSEILKTLKTSEKIISLFKEMMKGEQ